MIKKLLLSLLSLALVCALLAMRGAGEQKQPPLMLARQPVSMNGGAVKIKNSTPSVNAGSDVACALLCCPAVLSATAD